MLFLCAFKRTKATDRLFLSFFDKREHMNPHMSSLLLLYSIYVILLSLSLPPTWREVNQLDILASFIISVMASVVAYYICKWLDRDL